MSIFNIKVPPFTITLFAIVIVNGGLVELGKTLRLYTCFELNFRDEMFPLRLKLFNVVVPLMV